MRCKNCQHNLWNQPAPREGELRACAECGTPYTLGEFEYQVGKVKFCCKHCGTAYYGTSERGHLEPHAFNCATCTTPITMEDCVAQPHDAKDDEAAMLFEPIPWLGEGALLARWWRTVTMGFSRNVEIHRRLNAQPQPALAIGFIAMHGWISSAVSAALAVVMVLGVVGVFTGGGYNMGLGGVIALQIASFLIYPLYLLWSAAIAAWCVSLSPAKDVLPFRRALEVILYSSGALIFSLIPVCGSFLGFLFWIVHAGQAIAAAAGKDRATPVVVLYIVGVVAALVVNGVFWIGLNMLMQF